MSILIKGMEMPKSCINCMFCGFAGANCELDTCQITGNAQKHIPYSKMPDCPLIEVPPHGRLIDADKLMLRIEEYIEEYSDVDADGYHNLKWCAMVESEMAINDAPTVIEASEVE